MDAFAGLVTGQGTGAIGTILVFGGDADGMVREIFRPAGGREAALEMGEHYVGRIVDGEEIVDEVVVGREGEKCFAINCHGNPLVLARVMRVLEEKGVKVVGAEEIMRMQVEGEGGGNSIAVEAKLAITKARTLEGTRIVCEQIAGGLNTRVREWSEGRVTIEEMRREAKRILEVSEIARMLVFGCRVILAGAANSGKSTLFNQFCGRERAIVTDIRGTTRDWVSAECNVGGLSVELIDTAGLDNELAGAGEIDAEAQERAVALVEGADVVLLVLDGSEGSGQVNGGLVERLEVKRVVAVVNKCDLERRLELGELDLREWPIVEACAKMGAGVERIAAAIREVTGVDRLKGGEAVCLTGRQERLVRELSEAESVERAGAVITQLLKGGKNLDTD